jgi:hypothetical protein
MVSMKGGHTEQLVEVAKSRRTPLYKPLYLQELQVSSFLQDISKLIITKIIK